MTGKAKEMMTLARMRGHVTGTWYGPGCSYPAFSRHNQLSYSSCDVLARMLAGDTDYIPRYIGFIYGPDAEPVDIALSDNRYMTWSGLTTELASVGGNIQIAPFTYSPTTTVDGDEARYMSNATVFGAHTRSGAAAAYGFPLAAPYAGPMAAGANLYHAVLLAKPQDYIVVARVSLRDPGQAYPVKPDGFELALDWQISFF